MVLANNKTGQNVQPSTSKTRKPKPRTARQIHKQLKSTLTGDIAQPKSKKAASQYNRKITDFFPIRGRESIVKSPIVSDRAKSLLISNGHNSITSTLRAPFRSSDSKEVEVICLDDSDDDCDNQSSYPRSSEHLHGNLKFKQEKQNKDSSSPNLSKTKQDNQLDQNFKVDGDVEVVEMLPPIPLRNHPTFYVE